MLQTFTEISSRCIHHICSKKLTSPSSLLAYCPVCCFSATLTLLCGAYAMPVCAVHLCSPPPPSVHPCLLPPRWPSTRPQATTGSWDKTATAFLLILGYGAGTIPLSYCYSFGFSSPSTAQVGRAVAGQGKPGQAVCVHVRVWGGGEGRGGGLRFNP